MQESISQSQVNGNGTTSTKCAEEGGGADCVTRAKEQMHESVSQNEVKDNGTLHTTSHGEARVDNSVSRDSGSVCPDLSDMQAQVSIEKKSRNAIDVQQLDASAVKIDGHIVNSSVSNKELQSVTVVVDKVVVSVEREALDINVGCELTETAGNNVSVSEEPENNAVHNAGDMESQPETVVNKAVVSDEPEAVAGVTEVNDGRELTAVAGDKVVVSEEPKDNTGRDVEDMELQPETVVEKTVVSDEPEAVAGVTEINDGCELTVVALDKVSVSEEPEDITGHNAGNMELQPETAVDKVVVSDEPEALARVEEINDGCGVSATAEDKVSVSEEPKDNTVRDVDDMELQPETVGDKVVVSDDPERVAGLTEINDGCDLTAMGGDKASVSEEPEDSHNADDMELQPETMADKALVSDEPDVLARVTEINDGCDFLAMAEDKVPLSEEPKDNTVRDVDDMELQPETAVEKAVVSDEPETLARVTEINDGCDLTATAEDKVSGSEEPEDNAAHNADDMEIQSETVVEKVVVSDEPEALAGVTEINDVCELTAMAGDKVVVSEEPEDNTGHKAGNTVPQPETVVDKVVNEEHQGLGRRAAETNIDDEQTSAAGEKIVVCEEELQCERVMVDVVDKAVVSEEPEALAGATDIDDGQLKATAGNKVVVNEELEIVVDRKVTVVSGEVTETDGEVQCPGTEQRRVTCSEIVQGLNNEAVTHADMRFSYESSFSCREEAGKMEAKVISEVSKSETFQCLRDEKSIRDVKSDDYDMESGGAGDASGPADELNDAQGNAMEIDDVKGSPDHCDYEAVDEKIKIDDSKNSDYLHRELECKTAGTSAAEMEIDAVDAIPGHGICSEDHQTGPKSSDAVIVENQDSEEMVCAEPGREAAAADENAGSVDGVTPASGQSKNVNVQVLSVDNDSAIEDKTINIPDPVPDAILGEEACEGEYEMQKIDEKLIVASTILETEDPDGPVARCTMAAEINATPVFRQEINEESESHAVLVKCVNQGPECEPDITLGDCSDKNAVGAVEVGSNMEKIQDMQDTDANEQLAFLEKVPNESENELEEGEAINSVSESLDKDASDCVAQFGSNVESIKETREQTAIIEQIDSVKAASSSEQNMTKLHNPATTAPVDETLMHLEERIHEGGENPNASTPILETEDPALFVVGGVVVDLDGGANQDGIEECEGCGAQEQSLLTGEGLNGGVDQGVDCKPGASLDECLNTSVADVVAQDGTYVEDVQEAENEAVFAEQADSPREEVDEDPVSDSAQKEGENAEQADSSSEEVEEDPVSDSAKPRSKDEKYVRRGSPKPGSCVRDHRVTYQLPPENEDEFSVFDLVWGKVKSHPWWPGQIFHPSDSSEKAMKYYRKDCYLVAYFGDRSFAWNDASVLKPFRKYFPQEEKQSNSESFQNAVSCALAEVSRRVELGLACSCISEATYDRIKYQIVENAGIREESSKREGVDRSTGPNIFHSANLVAYVKSLAVSPNSGVDRLDLVIAKAQLLAFNRVKGCDALAEFQFYEGLTECGDETSLPGSGESELADAVAAGDGKARLKGPHKRKHNLKDIVYKRRKEKSMTELVGETMYYFDGDFDSLEEDDFMLGSPTSGSKRKASGCSTDDFTAQQSTQTISFARVSNTASSNPQQSFKVGECMRRVASQLTGSPAIIKSASDESEEKQLEDDAADEVIDAPYDSLTESTVIPQKQSSPGEMLSQLHLCALDPMKGYSFLSDIISFFYEFRNAAVSAQRQRMRKGPGRKRKSPVTAVGAPETFEFDDRNDSYWTDMVVQNNPEAKPAPARRVRKRKDQIVAVDPAKPARKYSRKQYFHGNQEPAAEIPSGDEKKQDQLPTELMLTFSDVSTIPSEANLNKMFKRFGPLKESETEIDVQSSRARLVFKKRSDAEVAYSSATMFNIFGSAPVNYQLNYTPSASFGTSPLALTDMIEHAS